MIGPRDREFVGRANSCQATCLLSGKSLPKSYIFRGQLILCLVSRARTGRGLVLARCRRRGIVSWIFSDTPTGGFDGIAATLRCRVKTGDKSNDGLIDGEILC